MLDGVKIKPLKKTADDRGFFTEIIRKDWIELLGNDDIHQGNFSISYPNITRAWHRHLRGQIDYYIVIKGALKICMYDDDSKELTEIISTGDNLQIVKVPGHYWHGVKVLGTNQAWLLYFVNKTYDYKDPDEERRPWTDQSIIPYSINGNKDDPRVGKPWNWNYCPNR